MEKRLEYDRPIWEQGIKTLCGIDEAGRGPLAGPVVAAAIILPPETDIPGVNDSKQLTAEKRSELKTLLQKYALDFATGVASEREIDRLNIVKATFLAMQRAVDGLSHIPEYLIVDGNQFPMLIKSSIQQPFRGKSVVKGDTRSLSIAAASILAKVYRDEIMKAYANTYPGYGFERHKGYGTKEHRSKIKELGLTPIHRRSFVKSLSGDVQLSLKDVHV